MKFIAAVTALLVALGSAAGCSSDNATTFSQAPTVPSTSVVPTTLPAKQQLVTIDDLPTGWALFADLRSAQASLPPCYASAITAKTARTSAAGGYVLGRTSPLFIENVEQFAAGGSAAAYAALVKTLNGCRTLKYKAKKVAVTGTLGSTSFPQVGDASSAYTAYLSFGGADVTLYLVVVKRADQVAGLSFAVTGTTPISTFATVIDAAVARIGVG